MLIVQSLKQILRAALCGQQNNITPCQNITYGRDVGYRIEQETFDQATHDISATAIRKSMGLS
jgi:hypothetical protein